MKPVLGVVSPMSMEASLFSGRRNGHRWNSDMDILCVRSGIGAENARVAACFLVDHGATALVVVGVSGGLDPALHTGDLIIPEIIFQDSAEDDWRSGKRVINASIANLFSSLLTSHGITVRRGTLLTNSDPVLTSRQKYALFIKYDAQAVDMESAAVFRVAQEKILPFLTVRSICDTSTTEIPFNFFQFINDDGSLRWPFLLTRPLLNPFLVPRLARFGCDFFRARMVLKTAWRLMLEHRLLYHFALGEYAQTADGRFERPGAAINSCR